MTRKSAPASIMTWYLAVTSSMALTLNQMTMYHNSAIFVNSLVQLLKCNLSPELHCSQTLTGLKRKAASCFWYSCTLVIVFRTQLRRSPKCVDVPGISRILTRVLGCYRTLISSLLLRSRDDIREVTPSYLGNILYVCNSGWFLRERNSCTTSFLTAW